ncbi:hypothetical protein HPB51_005328 [Rhipicephalus microplus]|uniref:Uncharacterized protein n=1 Tax=Rhipicephalus microplus TaxID=6941 RepID=A0A9J6EYT6_RHIMP|nr:hypothetical protein HPB51_005328 [Rhipicephalus microplus]
MDTEATPRRTTHWEVARRNQLSQRKIITPPFLQTLQEAHWLACAEMGIETHEEQPSVLASVGGLFSKIKSYIPTRKGGADFTSTSGMQGGPNTDNQTALDGSREVMESQ